MAVEFEISTTIASPPEVLYTAWLDSEGHSSMTDSPAEVSAEVGGEFTAWGGYIEGRNLELDSDRRILQAWRTSEFSDSEKDSRLEITFEPVQAGTQVTIRHTNLPPHGTQYEQGWVESYFEPMKRYFQANEG